MDWIYLPIWQSPANLAVQRPSPRERARARGRTADWDAGRVEDCGLGRGTRCKNSFENYPTRSRIREYDTSMMYRTQAWTTSQGEWLFVKAESMSHAAALTAAADSPEGGCVIVNVADPDVSPHPNGAPRVVHRFELAVTPRPDASAERSRMFDFSPERIEADRRAAEDALRAERSAVWTTDDAHGIKPKED